jgi:hypothetical protein
MKTLFGAMLTILAAGFLPGAQAGGISDSGINAYWGADRHGYTDVIGDSMYDISGATITRVGSILTVIISTSYAGHAGSDPWSAPGGIGYGDVFLAQTWNPFGSDSHHIDDNAANGTKWSYGFSLDNRWNNSGGTFKLYQLNGATNASNINNSESFMSCTIPSSCSYRNGQATAVNTASSSVQNTGLTGNWSVLANQELKFTINMTGSSLINFSSFAMHWGETCQNDAIEGITSVVPAPGSMSLLMLGLAGMLWLRQRRGGPTRAAAAL